MKKLIIYQTIWS